MSVYSYSSLSTYESCPLRYRYAYVDMVKPEEEVKGIEAFMGSRVHETLEKLYRDLNLSKENTLDDLVEYYNKRWEKEWTEDVRIVREGYTSKNYRDTGVRCIISYYNRYKPFDHSRTLGLEQVISVDIGEYKLRGLIDRLAEREDGCYEIHDYKTSQYLPTQRYFDEDRQLGLYQIGVEDRWDDVKEVDLIWHYLIFDKEIRSKRSEKDIEKLKGEITSLIKDIENAQDANEFPPKESALCMWCEYQTICPRWRHLIETKDMPVNEFLREPGVKLVNEYARLLEEKNAYLTKIEEKIGRLKEAIVAFAKREGVEVIRGSDKKLRVKFYQTTKFPNKKDSRRAELDNLLKKEGKWIEVSDLNTYTLARILKQGIWSPKLVDKIREYQTVEENYRLTLSTLREEGE